MKSWEQTQILLLPWKLFMQKKKSLCRLVQRLFTSKPFISLTCCKGFNQLPLLCWALSGLLLCVTQVAGDQLVDFSLLLLHFFFLRQGSTFTQVPPTALRTSWNIAGTVHGLALHDSSVRVVKLLFYSFTSQRGGRERNTTVKKQFNWHSVHSAPSMQAVRETSTQSEEKQMFYTPMVQYANQGFQECLPLSRPKKSQKTALDWLRYLERSGLSVIILHLTDCQFLFASCVNLRGTGFQILDPLLTRLLSRTFQIPQSGQRKSTVIKKVELKKQNKNTNQSVCPCLTSFQSQHR